MYNGGNTSLLHTYKKPPHKQKTYPDHCDHLGDDSYDSHNDHKTLCPQELTERNSRARNQYSAWA